MKFNDGKVGEAHQGMNSKLLCTKESQSSTHIRITAGTLLQSSLILTPPVSNMETAQRPGEGAGTSSSLLELRWIPSKRSACSLNSCSMPSTWLPTACALSCSATSISASKPYNSAAAENMHFLAGSSNTPSQLHPTTVRPLFGGINWHREHKAISIKFCD